MGPTLTSISAGGGLPVPYREGDGYVDLHAYFALWNAMRQRLAGRFAHPIGMEIEPGRYLVAESGCLVTEIRAVKRQGGNTFYLLDAGFNNLARPILYGSYHPMSIVAADGGALRPEQEVIVGGPLCESGDIFTQEEGGYVSTPPAAASQRRRPAGDRVRRRIRGRDGIELQLASAGRRGFDTGWPASLDPPPPDFRRHGAGRTDRSRSMYNSCPIPALTTPA